MKKLIGKGMFTKAYLTEKGKCFLETIDPIKLAIAEDIFVPTHRLFPKMKLVEANAQDGLHLIEMDYMPRPKSIKKSVTPRQWRLYKALREIFELYCVKHFNCDYERTDFIYDSFVALPSEFAAEKEALLAMCDGLRNYCSTIGFEISPRNVTVKGGKLILLDCFFCLETLKKVRKNY